MLFDTLKMSCEKLAEKDGEFKFLLQSFIKDHSSVNGLVDMTTVKSLYDMILDHARAYVVTKVEVKQAFVDKPKGCFHCGSIEHWMYECPWRNDQHSGKGNFPPPQPPPAKGKGKGQPFGQNPKGKGKGGKRAGGKKGGKKGGKGKYNPQIKECAVEEENPGDEDQDWWNWYGNGEDQTWSEYDTGEYDWGQEDSSQYWNQAEEAQEEEERDQPESDPKIHKTMWEQIDVMAKMLEAKEDVQPSLKALTMESVKVEKLLPEYQEGVLIDGGASHDVYYTGKAPEDAVESDVV